MRILEVCTDGYRDCLTADANGAPRTELCSGLGLGGLSPSLSTVRLVLRKTQLQVIAMLRNRPGGFCYLPEDLEEMFAQGEEMLKAGVHGLAFGFLNPNATINQEAMKKMIDLVHQYGGEAVCHRAFDLTPDLDTSIETLIELGCDRILTAGGQTKAMLGLDTLAHLQKEYGEKIQILAGSGVNEDNVQELLKKTGITQVHSSCRGTVEDPTAFRGDLSFGLPDRKEPTYDVTSAERVRAMLDNLSF